MKISYIKNSYRFDNMDLVEMTFSDNNNIIFGSNGSGKSSICQIFHDFKYDIQINNKFPSDGNPEVKFNLSNCEIEFNGSWQNKDSYNKDNLFVFSKKYLSESFFIRKNRLLVGEGISEYESKSDENINIENDIIMNLQEFKTKIGITRKGELPKEFKNTSKIYTTKSRLINLLKNSTVDNGYNKKFIDLFDANKYILQIKDLEIQKLIDILIESSYSVYRKPEFKYIKKYMDLERFTKFVFSFEKDLNICPICLKSFDAEDKWIKIKETINKEKDLFLSNNITDFITKKLDRLENDKSTYLNEYISILNQLSCFEYNDKLIDKLNMLQEKINNFITKSDNYLYSSFVSSNSGKVEIYKSNEKYCIDFEKNAISKNGIGMETAIKEFIIDYGLDNLRKYEIVFEEKTFSLDVKLKNSSAETDNLEEVFCESEITTLSLMLFVIDVKRYNSQTKTVIIDDPVDSADENIKHKIIYIITNEFFTKKITTILLTHKIDIIRLIKFHCKQYYLFYLSEEFLNLHIRIINRDRELLNNHFAIYNKFFQQIKNNILDEENVRLNLIAMSTMLRDIIEVKKNYTNFPVIHGNVLITQYKDLSNNVIHFNPITSSKTTFNKLIKLYLKTMSYSKEKIGLIKKIRYRKNHKLKISDSYNIDVFMQDFINNYTPKQYSEFNDYLRKKIVIYISIRKIIESKIYNYISNNCLRDMSNRILFNYEWNKVFKTTDLLELKSEKLTELVDTSIYFSSNFYKSLSEIINSNRTLINSIYHPISSSLNTYYYNSINEYMALLGSILMCK